MTNEQILSLQPGSDLDQAVHVNVFGGVGKLARYSTSDAAALKIIDRLPLFVGRLPMNHPTFDVSRPYIAGTLGHNPDAKTDVVILRVTAGSRLAALCKAALIFALRPARAERSAPRQSSADLAREVAARVGTPAARNPKAPAPRAPQPTTRAPGRAPRAPMPKRPEHFVGPDPKQR